MSRLLRIIDDWRDTHGQPSEASIARAIGLSPQAISSWRKRGFKRPPEPETLHRLAELTNLDYETVILRAALLDAGWIEDVDPPQQDANPPVKRRAGRSRR